MGGRGDGGRRDRPREHLPPDAPAGRRRSSGGSAGSTASSGWQRPILTDSGGFQVMSLAANRKLSRGGSLFRSHLDGSEHLLTPERAIELQARRLRRRRRDGPRRVHAAIRRRATEARVSMERTHRWAARSLARVPGDRRATGGRGALFGIVQGGMHADLRARERRDARGRDAASTASRAAASPSESRRRRCARLVAFTGPRSSRETAPLPDGRRAARRPRSRGGARLRPLRLRPPDAGRPARARSTRRRGRS